MALVMSLEVVELAGHAAPLGAAGLVACMWLLERRGASERERQLTAAHDRLMEQRMQLETLVGVMRDNTRALAALEDAQRQLHVALRDVAAVLRRGGCGGCGGGGVGEG